MNYIAIDIGSTFIKSAILNTGTGEICRKQRIPTPSPINSNDPFRFEIDAQLLFECVVGLIDQQLEAEDCNIAGILFSTQMHGFILTRGECTVTPYVSWQDRSADQMLPEGSYAQILRNKIGKNSVSRMGTLYKAGLAVCSLYTRVQQGLDASSARFHTLGGYLIFRLSGGQCNVCHLTNAAATGFADAAAGQWNDDIIKAAGCDALEFPKIVDDTRMVGSYRGIPLYADIGDHQASVYGAAADRKDAAILTIGTGAILSAPIPQYLTGEEEVRPYLDGGYLMTVTGGLPGGRALSLLVDSIADTLSTFGSGQPDKQDIWNVLWQQVPDQPNGIRVLPHFYTGAGEGSIEGIGGSNLRITNLFAAMLDSMVDAYVQALNRLQHANPNISRLILCGGKLAKSEPLRRRLKKETDLPIVITEIEDEALMGLMYIARRITAGRNK